MKNLQKKLEDKIILKNIIFSLGIRIPEFRIKLGYSTNTTIYNVTSGRNLISSDMINRILSKFPEVSYLYLKKGDGDPLVSGASFTTQKNILEGSNKDYFLNINEFIKLPNEVKHLKNRIKDLEIEIEKIKSGK